MDDAKTNIQIVNNPLQIAGESIITRFEAKAYLRILQYSWSEQSWGIPKGPKKAI